MTLEITPEGGDRFASLLNAIGFAEVEPPPKSSGAYRWFERSGSQIHLALVDEPLAPTRGHAAFVAGDGDLQPVIDRLAELDFAIEERARHWGERRVLVAGPDGHRVELMEAPPRPSPRRSSP